MTFSTKIFNIKISHVSIRFIVNSNRENPRELVTQKPKLITQKRTLMAQRDNGVPKSITQIKAITKIPYKKNTDERLLVTPEHGEPPRYMKESGFWEK